MVMVKRDQGNWGVRVMKEMSDGMEILLNEYERIECSDGVHEGWRRVRR